MAVLRKLIVAGLGAAVIGPLGANQSEAPPAPVERVLTPAKSAVQGLRSGYSLGVVPMPKLPEWANEVTETLANADKDTEGAKSPPAEQLVAPTPRRPSGCPVEIRGIVSGGAGGAFAIVASGDSSELLRAGQGIKTSLGWIAVSSIGSSVVTVRYDGTAYRCSISEAKR